MCAVRRSMSMQPRKATDKGGWLCMPLVVNTPEGKPGWEKVHCPVCGELCWKRLEDACLFLHDNIFSFDSCVDIFRYAGNYLG